MRIDLLHGPSGIQFKAQRSGGPWNRQGGRTSGVSNEDRLRHSTRHAPFKSTSRHRGDSRRGLRHYCNRLRPCAQPDDQPQGGVRRLLSWGKKFWETLTAEEQPPEESDGPQAKRLSPDATSAQATADSEHARNVETAALRATANDGSALDEATAASPLDTVDLADSDKPLKKAKSGAERHQVHLSTISRYKPGDENEVRTRSSVGGESVRIRAEKGAFARVGDTGAQKRYFDKIISATARREQNEKELYQRKKDFYHLSRQHEITLDWPVRNQHLTLDNWHEKIQLQDELLTQLRDLKVDCSEKLRAGDFKGASEAKAGISRLQRADQMQCILRAYEKALKEENYSWAASLRDSGGLGLVGWWWATSSSHDGVQPHLLRVSPGPNRLIFKAVTPVDFGIRNPKMNTGLLLTAWFDASCTITYMRAVNWRNAFAKEKANIEDMQDMLRTEARSVQIVTDEPESTSTADEQDSSSLEDADKDSSHTSQTYLSDNVVATMHFDINADPDTGEFPAEGQSVTSQGFAYADISEEKDEMTMTSEDVAHAIEEAVDVVSESLEGISAQIETTDDGKSYIVFKSEHDGDSDSDDAADSESVAYSEGPDTSQSASLGSQAESMQGTSKEDDSSVVRQEDIADRPQFDSEETARRKEDMLKSINLHHQLDTSTEVPILHLFFTANKDTVASYKETQSSQNPPASQSSVSSRDTALPVDVEATASSDVSEDSDAESSSGEEQEMRDQPGDDAGNDIGRQTPLPIDKSSEQRLTENAAVESSPHDNDTEEGGALPEGLTKEQERMYSGLQQHSNSTEARAAQAALTVLEHEESKRTEEDLANLARVRPMDIIRFKDDNDRFMLSVFPDTKEQIAAAWRNEQSAIDTEQQEKVQEGETRSIAPVSGQSGESVILTNQEQMQNLLRNFLESQGLNPNDISIDLKRTLEDTGVISPDAPQEVGAQDAGVAPAPDAFQIVADVMNEQRHQGLSGGISYRRLPRDLPKTDSFSGLFLKGNWFEGNVNGLEILFLQRVKQNGTEYVVAREIGANPNDNGKIAWRAMLGKDQRLEPRWYFHPILQVMARYKGQVPVKSSETVTSWVDGAELIEFQDTNAEGYRSAKLAFVPSVEYADMSLSLLHRIDLDDPMLDNAYALDFE